VRVVNFTSSSLGNVWKTTATIGLLVFFQTASAAPSARLVIVDGNPAYRIVTLPADPVSDAKSAAVLLPDPGFTLTDSGLQSGSDISGRRLAQAAEPAAPAATPPADPRGPDEPPPAASPPPSSTSKAAVVRAPPSTAGCGLRYLTAELSGKLKGRKWKQFREEECGPTTSNAVFPTAIAPKYAGEKPDKARTLTCADQFNVNKTNNGNDGLKWIEKGGGYYSECVSRLKG
jgi:hypothetical protein